MIGVRAKIKIPNRFFPQCARAAITNHIDFIFLLLIFWTHCLPFVCQNIVVFHFFRTCDVFAYATENSRMFWGDVAAAVVFSSTSTCRENLFKINANDQNAKHSHLSLLLSCSYRHHHQLMINKNEEKKQRLKFFPKWEREIDRNFCAYVCVFVFLFHSH